VTYQDWLAFAWKPQNDGQGDHTTPGDAGGETNRGVTDFLWEAWRRIHRGLPPLRNATQAQLSEILYAWIWLPSGGESLPPGPNFLAADFGMLSGPGTSVRIVQRCGGVEQDGVIGPKTLCAVAAIDPWTFCQMLHDAHAAYFDGLADHDKNGGWYARNDAALAVVQAALQPAQQGVTS
jgi:lysozyme family protein